MQVGRLTFFIVISAALQVPLAFGLQALLDLLEAPTGQRATAALPVMMVKSQSKPKPKPEKDAEPDLDGQLVEIAPPKDPTPPDEADYLAEHASSVDEETRTEFTELNPDVLAPVFSDEQVFEQEAAIDLNITQPSTGATPGATVYEEGPGGAFALRRSKWLQTNRIGTQNPVPASHTAASVSGAPQNDLLNEALGDEVALNAKPLVFAAYLNRIRRLVSHHWRENINDIPPAVRLVRSQYRTVVHARLDSEGRLLSATVTTPSGEPAVDSCLTRAFEMAGPFPNPPEGLVNAEGIVELPAMDFTLLLKQAENRYEGIDPRAGVRYPGILKTPR